MAEVGSIRYAVSKEERITFSIGVLQEQYLIRLEDEGCFVQGSG